MTIIAHVLPYAQIILSVVLVVGILFQHSANDAGSAFGGGSGSSIYHTRRGFEKFLFYMTIVVAILFAISSAIAILVK